MEHQYMFCGTLIEEHWSNQSVQQ